MKRYIASFDFDGTLRLDNMEKECIDLLESLPDNITSIINTGRGLGILFDKIKHYFPDYHESFIDAMKYFICNNGTDIFYKKGDKYDVLSEWYDHLKNQWDINLIMERLTPKAEQLEFELYPETYNFKVLYYFHRTSFEEADKAIEDIKSVISDLPIHLVHAESSQTPPPGLRKFVCEIFPKNAGKGKALIFLKEYMQSKNEPVEAIGCFGDDRNDVETIIDMPLKYKWWYGCLVGNSTDWIISRALKTKEKVNNQILIAPKNYPGPLGVEWLLKNLGWAE